MAIREQPRIAMPPVMLAAERTTCLRPSTGVAMILVLAAGGHKARPYNSGGHGDAGPVTGASGEEA